MLVEEAFRQAPQPGKGAVVEGQLLVAAEDSDGGVQFVQRVGMGIDMALQPCFRASQIRDIDSGADDARIAQRNLGERQRAALAAHHCEAFGLDDAVLATRPGGQIALALV